MTGGRCPHGPRGPCAPMGGGCTGHEPALLRTETLAPLSPCLPVSVTSNARAYGLRHCPCHFSQVLQVGASNSRHLTHLNFHDLDPRRPSTRFLCWEASAGSLFVASLALKAATCVHFPGKGVGLRGGSGPTAALRGDAALPCALAPRRQGGPAIPLPIVSHREVTLYNVLRCNSSSYTHEAP